MGFKINNFLVLCIIVALIAIASNAFEIRERREAPATTNQNTAQTIDELIEQFKTGVSQLAEKVKDNDLLQNITATLQKAGQDLTAKANDFMKKAETKQ
ncbi:unnamed protein product [Brassicogethes aeneus]|uniref:Uncharacterized protein n=1 Tax=Brassicogethes aeneus TaxID=1431903 RepID=A0A9P0AVE2_BRAAE|nr:unnamed protein product [Brassicogethes aeneus]